MYHQEPSLKPPSLSDILESSKKLQHKLFRLELPQIQLGLDQIRQCSEEQVLNLGMRDGDTKAHYLLAGSGMNAKETLQTLMSIQLLPFYESAPLMDTDIDGYLRYKKERNILLAIEDMIKQSQRDFDAFVARNVNYKLEKNKMNLLNDFQNTKELSNVKQNDVSKEELKNVTESTMEKSFFESSFKKSRFAKSAFKDFDDVELSVQHTPVISTIRQKYAEIVSLLNEFRLKGKGFGIFNAFCDVLRLYRGDIRYQQLSDSWKLLSKIVEENNYLYDSVSSKTTNERQFVSYIDNPASRPAMFKKIVSGAKSFLEFQFFSLIEREIIKYPHDAKLGGVPSAENKIRAYLNIKFMKNGRWIKSNLEIVNNIPIWAFLFYLIRCGYLEEAVQYTLKHESLFQKIEKAFPIYLKAYFMSPNGKLPRQLNDRLHAEYNQRIRFITETSDPYKYVIYKIIGRCELSKRSLPEVLPLAEDYMWLQLNLIRSIEDSGESVHERFTLEDVQKTLLSFGAKHFTSKGTNPIVYFQLLLLSGQFERAIYYLYSYYPIDAVHFAIGLTYYGLLHIPVVDNSLETELLSINDNNIACLNFSRLICVYTKTFQKLDPRVAVDYLCLICLNGDLSPPIGNAQKNICYEAIKELVLSTRDFSQLLGDVKADGSREPGIIEKRLELIQLHSESEYLKTITEQAAIQADNDGCTADAILLYHLSEDFDTVVSIINKVLGEALSSPSLSTYVESGNSSLKINLSLMAMEDPRRLAENMMSVYFNNVEIYSKITPTNRDACKTLLKIADARAAYKEGKWEQSLMIIEQLNVIPLDCNADIGAIKKQAQDFSSLHGSIARNVPGLLVMSMECLYKLNNKLKLSPFSDSSRNAKLIELRKRAKSAMIYAGLIQYRMSSEIYSHISRLDVMF
ncbi:hypothetical protein PNEG_01991 [Pneumocystis murina B123]|uniref:Nuclear pore protein n=1 Tax=Pneumocystis murina (strain B123) TaxID=1069680 RepID=M7P7I5_PNEMU|nr:hypothetical protein PNEG_01991 [Pneumocystis murina B123]EMR09810.1 hypothetical protein PNEG_01991 [Pneumocystis murina B123]